MGLKPTYQESRSMAFKAMKTDDRFVTQVVSDFLHDHEVESEDLKPLVEWYLGRNAKVWSKGSVSERHALDRVIKGIVLQQSVSMGDLERMAADDTHTHFFITRRPYMSQALFDILTRPPAGPGRDFLHAQTVVNMAYDLKDPDLLRQLFQKQQFSIHSDYFVLVGLVSNHLTPRDVLIGIYETAPPPLKREVYRHPNFALPFKVGDSPI